MLRPQILVTLLLVGSVVGCAGVQPTSPSLASATALPTPLPTATQIPGCLPQCVGGNLTQPGPQSGEYETRYFFGGQLTVTVPDSWYGYEDSTGELAVGPENSEDARVEFWIDIYAVSDSTGERDETVKRNGKAIAAWVASNPNLTILSRKPARLGDLPAVAFDWAKRADATNTDPTCPAELVPCVALFRYPEWDGAFTEGGPARDRFVIANATWGGESHTVYALIWAVDKDAFAAIQSDAMQMIEGARLPAGVEPAS